MSEDRSAILQRRARFLIAAAATAGLACDRGREPAAETAASATAPVASSSAPVAPAASSSPEVPASSAPAASASSSAPVASAAPSVSAPPKVGDHPQRSPRICLSAPIKEHRPRVCLFR